MANQDDHQPLTPEELAPHFDNLDIESLIAQEGHNDIYLATQTNLDRKVTLKIVPTAWAGDDEERDQQRFIEQARLMAKLSHRNIVGLHDFGTIPELNVAYFLVEYVEGKTLEKVIEEAPIEPSKIHDILEQVCTGLDYAHREGIWHLNIKPSNLVVSPDGNVKILDFGLAKAADGTGGSSGSMMGTPDYTAPEMFGEKPRPDHRSDIYSLGITLYSLLTGAPPTESFPPPSSTVKDCPEAFDQVIVRCIEEDPFDRFQQAKEIPAAIAAAFKEKESAPAASTSPAPMGGRTTIKEQQARNNKPGIRTQSREAAKLEVKRSEAVPAVDEERLARAAAQGEKLKKQAKTANIALWCAAFFVAAVLAPFIYLMAKRKMTMPISSSDEPNLAAPANRQEATETSSEGSNSAPATSIDAIIPEGMIAIASSAGVTPPEGTTISDWLAGAAWEAHSTFTVPPAKDLMEGDAQAIFEFGNNSRGIGLYLTRDGEATALSAAGNVEDGEKFLVPFAIEVGAQIKVIIRSEPNPAGTGTIITSKINPGGEDVTESAENTWVGGHGPDGFGKNASDEKGQTGGLRALEGITSITPFGDTLDFGLYAETAEE